MIPNGLPIHRFRRNINKTASKTQFRLLSIFGCVRHKSLSPAPIHPQIKCPEPHAGHKTIDYLITRAGGLKWLEN